MTRCQQRYHTRLTSTVQRAMIELTSHSKETHNEICLDRSLNLSHTCCLHVMVRLIQPTDLYPIHLLSLHSVVIVKRYRLNNSPEQLTQLLQQPLGARSGEGA